VKFVCLLLMIGSSIIRPLQLCAQPAHKDNPRTDRHTLESVTKSTLDAMRNNDVKLLSRVVDPAGLYIGIDASKMSAPQFRRDLSEKRGVYCLILDSSCLKNNGPKPERQYSLRQVLIRQPVTVNIDGIEGAGEMKAAVVKNANNHHEILFTLMFRRVDHEWKLQQIEYE
jgi:hypothetical protein